jgi:ABC-2 type transport system ATP-binding protein
MELNRGPKAMIRTEALTKFYGSRCAVRDLTVSIEDREIVGFLGLNGAGKTTTLRMLAGLLAPSSGKIDIDGQDMLATDAANVRWRIGFLPERPPLYDDMSVESYLEFSARLRGVSDDRVSSRVDEVLSITETKDRRREIIGNLSHGFRQRIGICQAIIHEPALVILDEPTGGLDPVQIIEMRQLIRSLKDKHTVLVSSHNLPEIKQTCDRLMVIRGGELVAVGTEGEIAKTAKSTFLVDVRGTDEAVREAFEEARIMGLIASWTKREFSGDQASIEAELTEGREAEELSAMVFRANLGLRRMQPIENKLESLFVELTKEAVAA